MCSEGWDDINHNYPKDDQGKENNSKWCFLLSYAHAFVVDGLKLKKDKTLTVQREVEGSEIEWALGAAYKELGDMLQKHNLRALPSGNFAETVHKPPVGDMLPDVPSAPPLIIEEEDFQGDFITAKETERDSTKKIAAKKVKSSTTQKSIADIVDGE